MFNFRLGSFGAFLIFDDLVSQKRLVVERKGTKFGPLGQVYIIYRVLLTVKFSSSIWGHSVHSDFQ